MGRKPVRNAAFAALVIAATAISARASSRVIGGSSFAEWRKDGWEFGVDTGIMCPTQKASFSHVIDNQRVYDLLADESVGDEVAEGFIAPPLPGSSVVAGTIRPTVDIGFHLYRQWTPLIAWGVEGGYGVKREVRVDKQGIYDPANFLVLHYSANIIHLTTPVKFGRSFGAIKPYLLAGPGLYLVQERATVSFNDSDDPQVKPLEIVKRDALHAGINAGVGVEWRVEERGLIGLDAVYHKVFSGAEKADFFLPKLRLSVLF